MRQSFGKTSNRLIRWAELASQSLADRIFGKSEFENEDKKQATKQDPTMLTVRKKAIYQKSLRSKLLVALTCCYSRTNSGRV
jgi:hypothetical protein